MHSELKNNDKNIQRSNFDAVRDAFAAQGFLLVSRMFDALATGIPNARPRLYMAAVAGLPADDGQLLVDRIYANLDSILQCLTPMPLSKFLLDEYLPEEYVPEDMIADWMPELRRRPKPPMKRNSTKSKQSKSKKSKPVKDGKTWAACPHSGDKGRYFADLNGNPWFELLTPREKDVLLLNLCQHPYPGLQEGVVTIQCSARFSRIATGAIPCQVPNARFW